MNEQEILDRDHLRSIAKRRALAVATCSAALGFIIILATGTPPGILTILKLTVLCSAAGCIFASAPVLITGLIWSAVLRTESYRPTLLIALGAQLGVYGFTLLLVGVVIP